MVNLTYLNYAHLPARLQPVSKHFHDLAHAMSDLQPGEEKDAGMRKLLEAKDCFVRAAVDNGCGGHGK